eukprot:COSAG06_NODE_375_length_16679_cov_2.832509_3_plen_270_part_00
MPSASAHEESQLLDAVEQCWDPSAKGPAWKAIGLLLGCTAPSAEWKWQKSTEVLTPKAKAAAEAAGKAAAKQRVVERHERILRERSAGATWDEMAVNAPKLNGDTGRGTGDALRIYWKKSTLCTVTEDVKVAVEAAWALAKEKKKAEDKEKKKADRKRKVDEAEELKKADRKRKVDEAEELKKKKAADKLAAGRHENTAMKERIENQGQSEFRAAGGSRADRKPGAVRVVLPLRKHGSRGKVTIPVYEGSYHMMAMLVCPRGSRAVLLP